MKKIITFAAVVAFGATLALSSCSKKKDWTCKCTITNNGQTTTQDLPITDKKKAEAKTACTAFDKVYSGAKCELK